MWLLTFWGYSSAGRALEWHSRGQRFDPAYLHQIKNTTFWSFFYLVGIVGAKRVKAVRQASDRQTRVCRCDFSRRSETERDPFKKWELPPRLPPPISSLIIVLKRFFYTCFSLIFLSRHCYTSLYPL